MTNAEQDVKIAQTKQEVDDFKSIVENFIAEMRDRDNKRDADIRELREKHDSDMKEFQKKHDADMKQIEKNRAADNAKYDAEMKALRVEIREATRDIRTFTIASAVGIGALVVSMIIFIVGMIFNPPQQQNYQPPVQTQNQNNLPQN